MAPAVRLVAAAEAWHTLLAAERGRFAPWLAVALGIGDLAYFALRQEPAPWAGAAALLGSAAGAWLGWRTLPARAAALLLVAASLGFGAAQLATWRALPLVPLPRGAMVVQGVVRSVEALPAGGRRITVARARLAPGAAPLARLVRLRLRDADPAAIAAGDRIAVRALIRAPSAPAWPGGWDLQRSAFFAGYAGYGFAIGPARVLLHARPHGIAAWWQALRDHIAHRMIAGLPGPDGAIAATLMTGTPTAIPEADRAAFRNSGLAHLLAVAGLHMGIVMGVAMGFSRLLLACSEHASLHWPCKQIAAIIALAVGGFYMALTGMHVPIERSFAMASLVLLGLLLGRRVLSLRGLAVAAAALLLLSPEQVVGVSFQMSFAAVLALISGYEAMRPWLRRLRGEGGFGAWLRTHLATLALTSLLAGTAALPFAAYDFGRVQLYYVVANMVAVPITAALVMPAGLAALLLMPIGLEHLALVPMGWGIEAVLWIGRGVASWPAAVLAVPHIPLWGVSVAAAGIAWLGLWRSRLRLLGLVPLAIGLASPAIAPPPDILVSDNAAMIALRTPQGVFLQRRRGSSKFVLEQWLQLWAAPDTQPMPQEGSAAAGAIACTGGVCRLRPSPGQAMALLVASGEATHDCAGAAVLVSAEPARHACPGGPPVVDRFTVWRNGTASVWLTADGARILTDRAARGARPWVPPPPVPRHHRVRPPASARRAGG